MQLDDSQERHAQLDDAVIEAERKLNHAREQQRSLERQAQEATFSLRSLQARQAELQRSIDTAGQQEQSLADELQRAQDEFARLSDAAAQAGLQDALAAKTEREQALSGLRSQYDDLTTKLRASDERRLQLERELEPLRSRITEFQLKDRRFLQHRYWSCRRGNAMVMQSTSSSPRAEQELRKILASVRVTRD